MDVFLTIDFKYDRRRGVFCRQDGDVSSFPEPRKSGHVFFRFTAALLLAVLISITGIALEKETLQLKRAVSRQYFQIDLLRELHSRLRLSVQKQTAPAQLARVRRQTHLNAGSLTTFRRPAFGTDLKPNRQKSVVHSLQEQSSVSQPQVADHRFHERSLHQHVNTDFLPRTTPLPLLRWQSSPTNSSALKPITGGRP